MIEYGKSLQVVTTPIPGLIVFELPVHGDARGWFKENWQREKMLALGLPDFGPVQNNVSFNRAAGTTRGIHAEPWDKWVSVATGSIFGAWVDLREGPTFGATYTRELDPSRAIFVPRGVGNSYQTLEPDTAYTYLVNDHWSPDAAYSFLNLADETAAVDWPIPLDQVEISEKDRTHPRLADVVPIPPRGTLVLTGPGGRDDALRTAFRDSPHVEFATHEGAGLAGGAPGDTRRWRDYGTIIDVGDRLSESPLPDAPGQDVWATNVTRVAALARVAAEHDITLVHVSSADVFDGTLARPYREDDPVCPPEMRGAAIAAGEAAASTAPRHYIVRTTCLVGEGTGFVRAMVELARQEDAEMGIDAVARPTLVADLVGGIRHLVDSRSPYGTYHLAGSGEPVTRTDIIRRLHSLSGDQHSPDNAPGGPGSSPPRYRVLASGKIEDTGFTPSRGDATGELLARLQASRPGDRG